ncbi:hypothetical protein LINGRAHAP2_LOCUS15852 [Linum grandiflorum]
MPPHPHPPSQPVLLRGGPVHRRSGLQSLVGCPPIR